MFQFISKYPNNTLIVLFCLSSLTLITNCATFQPQTVTCNTFGISSVFNADYRYTKNGFSALPPSGANWCVMGDGDTLGFSTRKYFGEYVETAPSNEEWNHNIGVLISPVKVKDINVSDTQAIKEFTEKWYRAGAPTTAVGNEMYAEITPIDSSKKLELRDLKIETDETYETDCVRFEAILEGRDNPVFPSWNMRHFRSGVLCRHPYAQRILIEAVFTEFHRSGQGLEDPNITAGYYAKAERTINSLEFTEF